MAFPHPDLTPWRPVDSVCFGFVWCPDFGEIKPPLHCASLPDLSLLRPVVSVCFGCFDLCQVASVGTSRFANLNPSRHGQLKAFPTLAKVFLVSLDPPCCSDALAFSQGEYSRGPFAVKGFLPVLKTVPRPGKTSNLEEDVSRLACNR